MKSEIPNPNVRNSRVKTQRRQAFLCDFATLREICSYRWLLISDLFQISDSGLRISDLICCLLFDFFSNVEVLIPISAYVRLFLASERSVWSPGCHKRVLPWSEALHSAEPERAGRARGIPPWPRRSAFHRPSLAAPRNKPSARPGRPAPGNNSCPRSRSDRWRRGQ